MSDSPETDAEAMDGIDCYGDPLKIWDYKASKDGEVVLAEFARRIERERDEALEDRDEARRELAEARRSLKHIEEYGAEKINAAVSLRQELTKAMGTDWTAIGYREGISAALHSGGIRGAKWHAERKGLQGEAADNYISGFNAALDEYKQDKA